MPSGGYKAAFRFPGTKAFFLAAVPGRLGIAMTGLGMVWLVQGTTGSFASAGVVTGAFALTQGIVGPQAARLVDRLGQPRVLPPWLAAHAFAATALIVLATVAAPTWSMLLGGAMVGATVPQLGALSAARWSYVFHDSPALTAGYAADSLSNGIAYLAGPALAGVLAALVHPAMGSAMAAGLIVASGVALAVQKGTAPPPTTRSVRDGSPALLTRRFVALVGVNGRIGLYFGAMQVAVTGTAVGQGATALAGPIYSVMSAASLASGLLYGMRSWRAPASSQLVAALGGLALGSVPLLFVSSPATLAAALVVPGLALAPALILSSVLTQAAVERGALTQALTWLNSTSAAGSAAANAMAGVVFEHLVGPWSFGVALVGAVTAALVAGTLLGNAHRPEPGPDDEDESQ